MNHHDEYDNAQLPDYARDPDYLDDIRDPARAARGLFYGMLLSVPFWLLIIVVVALVKSCTGGG